MLSLFPGVGLLDRAFAAAGFCVVRGPDLLWGGDIRDFHPPAGHFWGVVGGPPCQDFSSMRRAAPTGEGLEMLAEFARAVTEAQPEWWLAENVSRVPDLRIEGYNHQRLDLDQAWWSDTTRLRHVQFGSRSGRLLHVERAAAKSHLAESHLAESHLAESHLAGHGSARHGAALANDGRPFRELCRLQGLPDNFDLPGMTVKGKKRAVGNGVPLVMGRALAEAIVAAYASSVTVQRLIDGTAEPPNVCACGCGRRVAGRHRYYDFSCRKRAQRRRDRSRNRERAFP